MPYEEDKLIKSPLQQALDQISYESQFCLKCKGCNPDEFCPEHAELFAKYQHELGDESD